MRKSQAREIEYLHTYFLEKKLESSSLSDIPVLIHDLIIGNYKGKTILDILIENKATGLI
jgi:hypothetical protein